MHAPSHTIAKIPCPECDGRLLVEVWRNDPYHGSYRQQVRYQLEGCACDPEDLAHDYRFDRLIREHTEPEYDSYDDFDLGDTEPEAELPF